MIVSIISFLRSACSSARLAPRFAVFMPYGLYAIAKSRFWLIDGKETDHGWRRARSKYAIAFA
ncbi:MAG: hypothetical protein WBG73_02015 [Coleofasciculaceae cyanobacterium]